MSDIVHPLSAAAVGLANLRYFRPPLPGHRMVWHSWQDMQQCLALPRDLRREFIARLRKEWGKDTRAVMTEAGPTTIAPHFMAQGLIHSMQEFGRADAQLEHQYVLGLVAATKVYHRELGITDEAESVNYTLRPFREENGIAGPHPVLEFRRDGE
ncbi:MAG: hypothetical protein J0I42_20305 [Bosea sp.]|uniref:hypothetical protein n=1 Tax=Bosea sp. (in: a-proteobacteria) TaxID=1871050 RepID=UPI001AD043AD|nr:hypothetical protein [Bosea sp. (in: a-proteobacteria)]MBN9454286.1 hypothetical protein [Bosea sp. (in: a-proteobacteria)]